MNDRVFVGRIGRPHGLAGELYVRPETDAPDQYRAGAVFLTDEVPARSLEVRSSRRHQEKLLIKFVEVIDRTDAESLRGTGLTIAGDDRRPLADDEYWPDQLVGLSVRTVAGKAIGTITDVDAGGPQDRLIVQSDDGRQGLIPFVRELVPEVDVPGGWVVVDLIEGMLSPPPE